MTLNDDAVERRLRAYRPAAPPAALRGRLLAETGGAAQTLRGWLPAVAALLVASFFYWLAATERRALAARLPAISSIEHQVIEMEQPQ